MSTDEYKENTRRVFEEAFGQGNTDVIDEVLRSDFVCYDPNSESGEIRGAETIKGEIEYFRNAIPELTNTAEDHVAGDKMAIRHTVSGSHQGEFFGVLGSGKSIQTTGINIDLLDEESGKLVEEWPGMT